MTRRRAREDELERAANDRLLTRLAVLERAATRRGEVRPVHDFDPARPSEPSAAARLAAAQLVSVRAGREPGVRLTVAGRLVAESALQVIVRVMREASDDGPPAIPTDAGLPSEVREAERARWTSSCACCGAEPDACELWCLSIRRAAEEGARRRIDFVRHLTSEQIAAADRRDALPDRPPARHLVLTRSGERRVVCGQPRPRCTTDRRALATCARCLVHPEASSCRA